MKLDDPQLRAFYSVSKTIPSYTQRCYLGGLALLPHHLAQLHPWERSGLDLILPLWDGR